MQIRRVLFVTVFSYGFIVFGLAQQSKLEILGLEGIVVTSLSRSKITFLPRLLCAGTDSTGVYVHELTSPDSVWENLGLENKRITAVHLQEWGVGPGAYNTIFAGIKPGNAGDDSTLVYRYTLGTDTSWVASDSGVDASAVNDIGAIGGIPYGGHAPYQPVFVGGRWGGKIYRSYDWQSWENVFEMSSVNVIQEVNWTVWAGGESGFFAPYLARSEDRGSTWEVFIPDTSGDNACYSIATDPNHPDTLYVGIRGAVIKTEDGGQSWVYTGLRNAPYVFSGLALDPINSHHLVAGGTMLPSGFGLFESYNGGDSWTEIAVDPQMAGISSMVGDTQSGEFVVYLGTLGNGVFRYSAGSVNVDEPELSILPLRVELKPVYPNPFNPTTTIEFSMAQGGLVTLTVYDLLGREVETILNRHMSPGHYEEQWDASNLPSGIYFVRMEVGQGFTQTWKVTVLR